MIDHRKPGRTVPPPVVGDFRQDEHEAAPNGRLNLEGRRTGSHPSLGLFPGFTAELQRAMAARQDLFQFCKLSAYERTLPSRVGVVEGDLKEFSIHKPGLQGSGLVTGKRTLGRRHEENLQAWLPSRSLDRLIQARPHCPLNQPGRWCEVIS